MDRAQVAASAAPDTADRLREAVEILAGFGPRSDGDTSSVRRTLQYIQDALADAGYVPELHRFGPGVGDVNIFAERPGTSATPKVYELGAHYDTVPGSPGADDNASGVAGLLEAARMLTTRPSGSTVRLCFFGGEERRALGSNAHVARLEKGELASHGAVILECIGFCAQAPGSQRTPLRIPLVFSPPTAGNFIAAIANWRSRRLARSFQRAARRGEPGLPVFAIKLLGGLLHDTVRSDHHPYWRAGRHAMMITDTANFRNQHYHRPTDLPDTLEYAFLAKVVRATVEGILLVGV